MWEIFIVTLCRELISPNCSVLSPLTLNFLESALIYPRVINLWTQCQGTLQWRFPAIAASSLFCSPPGLPFFSFST